MAQATTRIQRMDKTNRAIEWPVEPWRNRAEWNAWWDANGMAHNRLAVTDPAEWERIAQAIETFHRRIENERSS